MTPRAQDAPGGYRVRVKGPDPHPAFRRLRSTMTPDIGQADAPAKSVAILDRRGLTTTPLELSNILRAGST